ncbi:unnamed protein product [Linum tenue]|uniref:Uncharacterized protein n=1 Tax=Linum tenue TaxID=586396 RepID=A0AAV0PL04_9ROSI|nr:unnamed protein product [Linum tenue]
MKDTLRDPLKGWRTSFPAALRSSIIKLKLPLAFCALVSISLLLYSAYPTRPALNLHNKPNPVSRLHVATNPAPPPTNLSHIVFGIAGSSSSWNLRRHYSALWWRPNVTRGHAWLDAEPPLNESSPSASSPPYRVSADASRFKYTSTYGSRSAVRIARIIKESFELLETAEKKKKDDDVRWFVMGDDDTVFFLENLVTVLAKYDHEQMYYVGSNSESVEQDVIHSYDMAYGGGGFAVSYPLARELVSVLDGCIDRYASFYGSDQKVQGCMTEIGIPLTKELGFHQMDIRGNPYGLLAAHPVAPLVSLHHLDYLRPIFPNTTRIEAVQKLMESYARDPSRALQRSFCHDLRRNWTVSVSWGYTVQLYPSLVTAKRLDATIQTFKTWRTWKESPFTFNTRPAAAGSNAREVVVPVLYFLDSVGENVGGEGRGSLTTYRRHVAGLEEGKVRSTGEQQGDRVLAGVRAVHVAASTMDPKTWTMAPRRQCCEVMDGGDGADSGVVRVKVRRCNPFESATLP